MFNCLPHLYKGDIADQIPNSPMLEHCNVDDGNIDDRKGDYKSRNHGSKRGAAGGISSSEKSLESNINLLDVFMIAKHCVLFKTN
jgi:hypothetical protein